MGVGGGIVFDSDAAAEYEECLLKARFLSETIEPFSLIETMRLENGTFYLLRRHIRRLESSAGFFGYPFDEGAIRRRLASEAEKLNEVNGGAHRLRLLLDENGNVDITSAALEAENEKWSFIISPVRADRRSPFTFHKTTRRQLYDRERAAGGCDEVVFLNDRGEITEGSMTNIFIQLNGLLLTPPLACGLLAGTFRQDFLDRGKAREAVLTLEDLGKAERIFLANSVRGLCPARRIFPATGA
jgi:para-aminobenzoate synthetase/4-amino-4-deoxychorismate lyase